MTTTRWTDDDEKHLARIQKLMTSRSFCTLATSSAAGRAHVAGVLYEAIGTTLYVHTMRSSRKARSIAGNPHVAVCVPVRRLPVGPPFTIQFQARAEILAMDDPAIVSLLEQGRLAEISAHGALDAPDGCFLRIAPTGRIFTFGIGVPLLGVIRDPLNSGARDIDLCARD